MTRPLTFGTRASALAQWQTRSIVEMLQHIEPGLQFDIKTIKTEGDKDQVRPLAELGGQGVFTKALEDALLDGSIDVAVHSLKDLPTETTADLEIAAIPERADPRDCLISTAGICFAELPKGARVGTSSARRAAQILSQRPDLQIVPIRGNVDTRLRKVREGIYDAVVLAAAGITRLGRGDEITEHLAIADFLPDPGQGALAIQIRADDAEARHLVSKLDHGMTRASVTAERAFLSALGGGCHMPLGAYADATAASMRLTGIVATTDGTQVVRGSVEANNPEPDKVGLALAAELLTRGAYRILNFAPLAGKRILVTRARDQAGPFIDLIRDLGGEPIEFPTIQVEPLEDFSELDQALTRVRDFDWVVFTSVNGVRAVLARLTQLGQDHELFQRIHIAAIGPVTQNALRSAGLDVHFVPSRYLGAHVAAELPIQPGQSALLLRADLASTDLKSGLEQRGVRVLDIDAYRTVAVRRAGPLFDHLDAITFTSSSTAVNLAALTQAPSDPLLGVDTFCIGPVTASTARELGFRVAAVASEHTTYGLVKSLIQYYLIRSQPKFRGSPISTVGGTSGKANAGNR